jgi:hypothetical protein
LAAKRRELCLQTTTSLGKLKKRFLKLNVEAHQREESETVREEGKKVARQAGKCSKGIRSTCSDKTV